MHESLYHRVLRVSAVIVTFILLFDGGFISPLTKELSDNTISYLANSVGITASVSPNQYNELNAQLAAREQAVSEREIAARSFNTSSTDYSTYILSVILFILTVLIMINYVMDWARARRMHYEKQVT